MAKAATIEVRVTGDVLALREALKESTALLAVLRGDEYEENITRQIDRNTDVLSAPLKPSDDTGACRPRNCDLYKDCNAAWKAYNALDKRERLPGFDYWLFEDAKQEGGAK